MQLVTIQGDMLSDRTSDNYPSVPMCFNCIKADEARGEESNVVAINGEASPEDGPCVVCGATA